MTGGASGDDEEEPSSSDSNGSAVSLRNGFSRPPRPPSAVTRKRRPDDLESLEVVIPGMLDNEQLRNHAI